MNALATNRWVRIGARVVLAACVADVVIGVMLVAGYVFAENVPERVLVTGVFFIVFSVFGYFWLRRKFTRWGLIANAPRPSTSTFDLL